MALLDILGGILGKKKKVSDPVEPIAPPSNEVGNFEVQPRPLAVDPAVRPRLADAPVQDVTSQVAVNPLSAREKAEQDFSAELNKDYSKPKSEGGARDEDHNWWDGVKSALLGALVGSQGGLPGVIAGGITGGIRGAVDRNADEKLISRNFKQPALREKVEMEREAETFGQQSRLKDANIAIAEQKPDINQQRADIAEFKAINDAQYKNETLALGKQKADDNRKDRERIFQLRQRGADQTDMRIKLLEQQIEERIRSNKVREAQGQQRIDNTQSNQSANRAQRETEFQQRLAAKMTADSQKGLLNKQKIKTQLAKDAEAGEISQETFEVLLRQLEQLP